MSIYCLFFNLFLDEELDSLICSLARFYKGAASFEWLENQPISRLLILNKEAHKIIKEENVSS